MAGGRYVECPSCAGRFLVGDEFFVIPEASCHCPYCHEEFHAGAGPAPGAP